MRAQHPTDLLGRTVYDRSGEKIGTVGQVFLDDNTGQPAWATVHTGLFGLRESFVPVERIRPDGDGLLLPVAKETVKNAPSMDASEGHLDPDEVGELYRYYELPYHPVADGDDRAQRTASPTTGRRRTGPEDGPELVRHEEHLEVGAERVERGRVRLRKYVVTEDVQMTVPVRHEEVRVEREPVQSSDSRAVSDRALAEEEVEVVLHGERPVVRKETVPVEKVRLTKDVRTEQRTVSGKVRKERIDVQDEAARAPARPGPASGTR